MSTQTYKRSPRTYKGAEPEFRRSGVSAPGQQGSKTFVLTSKHEPSLAPYYFNADNWSFEVIENRKYVMVDILTGTGQRVFPKQTLTYEDTLKNLCVGDIVQVPVGHSDKPFVGKVVDYGRGGWDGYTKAVIGRLVLDDDSAPF